MRDTDNRCVCETRPNYESEYYRQEELIKKELKYYLSINEENGVVYIPKFVVYNLVKEMVGEEE